MQVLDLYVSYSYLCPQRGSMTCGVCDSTERPVDWRVNNGDFSIWTRAQPRQIYTTQTRRWYESRALGNEASSANLVLATYCVLVTSTRLADVLRRLNFWVTPLPSQAGLLVYDEAHDWIVNVRGLHEVNIGRSFPAKSPLVKRHHKGPPRPMSNSYSLGELRSSGGSDLLAAICIRLRQ